MTLRLFELIWNVHPPIISTSLREIQITMKNGSQKTILIDEKQVVFEIKNMPIKCAQKGKKQ